MDQVLQSNVEELTRTISVTLLKFPLKKNPVITMAKRTSNKDRIRKKALEADAKAEEKKKAPAEAKAKKKKVTSKKASVRLKVLWKVFNPLSKEVAAFPYRDRDKAEAKAAELSKKYGKEYTVRDDKVPMD